MDFRKNGTKVKRTLQPSRAITELDTMRRTIAGMILAIAMLAGLANTTGVNANALERSKASGYAAQASSIQLSASGREKPYRLSVYADRGDKRHIGRKLGWIQVADQGNGRAKITPIAGKWGGKWKFQFRGRDTIQCYKEPLTYTMSQVWKVAGIQIRHSTRVGTIYALCPMKG
jgi:hypothetical protein